MKLAGLTSVVVYDGLCPFGEKMSKQYNPQTFFFFIAWLFNSVGDKSVLCTVRVIYADTCNSE